MVAYTDSLGFNKGTAAYFDRGEKSVFMMETVLDFAKIAAARAAAGVAALAATDTLEIMPLPPHTFVLGVSATVETVEGAAATIDIGDAGSATRFLSNVDLNAATDVASVTTYYNATGATLRATIDSASIDVAVVRIRALVAGRQES